MTIQNQDGLVDIDVFDAAGDCETAQELELLGVDGITTTGIKLLVLGEHAERVEKFFKTKTKQFVSASEIAKKQGKESEFSAKLIDNSLDREVDGAAVRVTGWLGVKQPFADALLKHALKRNPHWIPQINKFSSSIGNFTKLPSSTSSSTPDTNSGSENEAATA